MRPAALSNPSWEATHLKSHNLRPEESWAVGPPKLMKTSTCSATTFLEAPPSPLSSRPERTRISYFAALTGATGAVSRKGNRMKLINVTTLNRKSGGA